MIFKYWIEFDDEGEITHLYRYNPNIPGCEEYIIKLIPIDRKMEDLDKKANEFVKSVDKASKSIKKFETEFEKATKDLRRIKI